MKSGSSRSLPQAVIDTTLLSRLANLEIVEFLPMIFSNIRIPLEVKKEAFRAKGKKKRLKNIISENSGFFNYCYEVDEFTKEIFIADHRLDKGEAAAIAQADFTKSVLIIDEDAGYKVATSLQITVYRTVKILILLHQSQFITHIKPFLDKLRNDLGFHLSQKIYEKILRDSGEL